MSVAVDAVVLEVAVCEASVGEVWSAEAGEAACEALVRMRRGWPFPGLA